MKRRTAVKYLFVVAAGSALLPSCLSKTGKASISLKHLDINADDEKTLAEIGETIIPAGAAPGSKDTYAHLFVMRMLDEMHTEQDQNEFMKGLRQVNDLSKKRFGGPFIECSVPQRNEIVRSLEDKQASKEAVYFYKTMKNYTVQGYLLSKPVMGGIFKYELVPGRYNGFFPVKTVIHQV